VSSPEAPSPAGVTPPVERRDDDEADADADADADAEPRPFRWRLNLLLFGLTVVSVFYAGATFGAEEEPSGLLDAIRILPQGYRFALPLLAILVTHEFGHYFAARYHKVDASLPYFIPLPRFSPFGTMGAIIAMRGRIKSRDALLDIGASGPLAGLLVAVPVLAYGLATSHVGPMSAHGMMEGQSLFYLALKRVVIGRFAPGSDVDLNPVAFAGWAGLLVTALNLLPIGQLDGGHVAYALFGKRQNRYARIAHFLLLAMFAFNLIRFAPAFVRAPSSKTFVDWMVNSLFWLVWWGALHGLKRVGGPDHPPTEPGELHPARRVVAVVTLVLFVLLFMPAPMTVY
jgi:membrane-associated protease RseP (regulator of RpoE activity)